ncbi:MAG: hypothetical protein A2176_12010 [Spirochaetes bacterium RBG_13_51_14]|nr:MAG: hypothetical protein A2176_12010 [Spirochaetes bacterium RBG_13_51_14]
MALCTVLAAQPACLGKKDRIKHAFGRFAGPYVIYVSKKDFLLEVYDRNVRAVAGYRIAYGSNPDMKPKLCEGDNRTPEGLYRVNEILSMDVDKKSPSYKVLKGMNKKYFRASEGHSKFNRPGVDLGDNAYGPRFFGLTYPNSEDRKRYRKALRNGSIQTERDRATGIGYGIAIHGNNDENSVGHLSSNGCIRMYNRDVVELDQYVRIGTPVIIAAD